MPPIPLVSALISAAVSASEPLVGSLSTTDTAAQVQQGFARTLPDGAKKGVIQFLDNQDVLLDGSACQLAPGAQIRDANNFIVMPFSLRQQVKVRYLMDDNGQLTRAWILSAQEAAQ